MLGRLTDPEIAHRRRWLTLLVLCLSLMVIGIDNTILNVAIPTLAKPTGAGGLGASASELQWIVDAYTIVFAGLLLTSGSLGDRFGRYRFLTIGLLIFGAGSAMSAFAPSATVLIGTRALMGIGASAIMPATLSVLTNVFHDPRERAKAIGVWAGVSAIGIAVGPIAGGVLLEHFWWGSVFLVNVPVVAVALFAGYLLVPDSKDPHAGRLDPLGSILSIAGLTVLLWAVIEGPSTGWTSPSILAGFVVGGAVLAGFFVWELKCSNPMLDVHFFENPRFSAASGAITLAFLALFGTIFLLTQYTQQVLGYSTVEAGAIFLPQSIVLMIFAPLSTRWVHKFGSKAVVSIGLFILAVSLVLMATFQTDSSAYWVVAVTALSAFGMAHVVAPATDSIMGSLPRAKAGVGSAMNDTTRQVGGAVGVALLGSILASAFRPKVQDLLLGHVPGSLLAKIEDSLGSALGVARGTPSAKPFAGRIVDAAQTSFVHGMHAAVLVAAVVAVIGGIATLIWLPARARTHPDDIDVVAHDGQAMADTAVDGDGTISPRPAPTPSPTVG
jgi:EmrB/QacA subfamily drug resistance transporter